MTAIFIGAEIVVEVSLSHLDVTLSLHCSYFLQERCYSRLTPSFFVFYPGFPVHLAMLE
jgi:hypothetical protein